MSNAVITHYETRPGFALCGKAPGIFVCYSTNRSAVTCKRCLASLAKRDLAFQAKSKRGLAITLMARVHRGEVSPWASERAVPMVEAARAIAREEGLV